MNLFPKMLLDLTTFGSGQIAKLSKDICRYEQFFTDVTFVLGRNNNNSPSLEHPSIPGSKHGVFEFEL